jgi:hypothetical protein
MLLSSHMADISPFGAQFYTCLCILLYKRVPLGGFHSG